MQIDIPDEIFAKVVRDLRHFESGHGARSDLHDALCVCETLLEFLDEHKWYEEKLIRGHCDE